MHTIRVKAARKTNKLTAFNWNCNAPALTYIVPGSKTDFYLISSNWNFSFIHFSSSNLFKSFWFFKSMSNWIEWNEFISSKKSNTFGLASTANAKHPQQQSEVHSVSPLMRLPDRMTQCEWSFGSLFYFVIRINRNIARTPTESVISQ